MTDCAQSCCLPAPTGSPAPETTHKWVGSAKGLQNHKLCCSTVSSADSRSHPRSSDHTPNLQILLCYCCSGSTSRTLQLWSSSCAPDTSRAPTRPIKGTKPTATMLCFQPNWNSKHWSLGAGSQETTHAQMAFTYCLHLCLTAQSDARLHRSLLEEINETTHPLPILTGASIC